MKKTLLILLSVFCLTICSFAQQENSKIDFKSIDLPTALKMAKENNKMVFCSFRRATLNNPCKSLFANVYCDEEVGAYMNDKFISLDINTEAQEWVNIAKEYKIASYPTMIVLNANGSERCRMVGEKRKTDFILEVKRATDDRRSPEALKKRYNGGERSAELIDDYASFLMKSDEDRGYEVIESYYKSLSDMKKVAKENWFLFSTFSTGMGDSMGQYLMKNYTKFYTSNDKKVVDDQVAKFAYFILMPYISGSNTPGNGFNQTEFNNDVKLVSNLDIDSRNMLNALVNIVKARVKSDLDEKDNCEDFIKVCQSEVNNIGAQEYYMVVGNFRFMILKASDEAKNIAIEILTDYNAKYGKGTPHNDIIERIKKDLKPTKRDGVISFEGEDMTFALAQAKAKKENKLIFIDCYTVWCTPCKKLAKEVFTVNDVKEYFDANFINMKIDMEKGEGIELAKRFKVKSFPTLLLINGAGEVVLFEVGVMNAEVFLEKFKTANENYKK